MVPIRYWLFRTIRRNIPQRLVDAFLDLGVFIKPGRDTSSPERAVEAYRASLAECDIAFDGQTVCLIGFGGAFALGIRILESGAKQIVLQDPYARERTRHNKRCIPLELRNKYFRRQGRRWLPRADRIAVVREDLEHYANRHPASVNIVLSNSVLEHVKDVDCLVRSSVQLMSAKAVAVHFVDVRDHYFTYPFEMLCYDERTWKRWLDASNTLNRLRVHEYEAIFRTHFETVSLDVIARLSDMFRKAKPRIRAEFLTGNDSLDSASVIRIVARRPRATAPSSGSRGTCDESVHGSPVRGVGGQASRPAASIANTTWDPFDAT